MGNRLILKFYFGADRLDSGINRLIESLAFRDMASLKAAERIERLTIFKSELNKLYNYLDNIMQGLKAKDIQTLRDFALGKKRCSKFSEEERREVKRALMKFSRHLRRIDEFEDTLKVVEKYYAKIYL